MMALLLVCSLTVTAFAAEYDLALGSVIVNATESGQTVTHGSNAAVPDSAPVITQSNSSTPTTNTVTITAAADTTANVTLSGVNIDTGTRGGAAVEIKGNGDVVIELDGSNTVQSGDVHAGVEKNTIAPTDTDSGSGNGNLTITDGNETNGSLKATGGDFGAGIGGGVEGDASNITITGGKVEATGSDYGAGIGGGGGGSGSNITITGSAEVTAKSLHFGAGIGGGDNDFFGGGSCSGSYITISGSAEVNAEGGFSGGAGIGGGYYGSGSDITISGGKVEATGLKAAGIGGGYLRSGSSITITGGKVEATGYGGAGIGGGMYSSGSDITISGSAEVIATGNSASGIGGGYYGSGSDITISGSAEVTAKGGAGGAGIGGGKLGTGSDITISEDAQVKVQGGEQVNDSSFCYGVGAAIGDGGKEGDSTDDIAGEEKNPNTDELTPNGKIEYYAPGVDMETGAPTKTVTGTYGLSQPTEPVQPAQPEEEAPQIAAPYRVVGQDGKNLACKKAQSSGVLTITVDADFATLTGSASGLKTLKAQGIDTIVFVTNGATSTFALADLLASMTAVDSYSLTHDGDKVTFTLSSGEDIGKILK